MERMEPWGVKLAVLVVLVAGGAAKAQVEACKTCWTDACPEFKGAMKKCPAPTAPAGQKRATANPAPKTCSAGQVRNEDTQGRCCWPGQVWDLKCRGVPTSCPDGFSVDSGSEGCRLEECPDGKQRMKNGVTCCWPGQVAPSGQCRGRPTTCPTHFEVVGEVCSDEAYRSEEARRAEQAEERAKGSCPRGMVWIPGGAFTMGERGDRVTVKGFCLDVTEVTVEAYARRGVARTTLNDGTSEKGESKYCNGNKENRQDHPVNCVNWDEAVAYCEGEGKRLPTEEEWEWAARGGANGWAYPWGDEEPSNQACWDGEGNTKGKGNRGSTCAVGTFRGGANPQGVMDLAGNVWEWTASKDESSPARVSRGGSWCDVLPVLLRASVRNGDSPSFRNDILGFRCARTP